MFAQKYSLSAVSRGFWIRLCSDCTWQCFASSRQKSNYIFRIPEWFKDNLLFLDYFRKITLTTCLQKARRDRFIFINLIQYPHTLNSNIYHWNKQEPPPFFHSGTNTWLHSGPFCLQNPCSGCDSGTDLVDVLEYNFVDFVPTLNKSLRFTRFRRSYINLTAIILTNHCQNYTARCTLFKVAKFFFLQLFVPNDSAIAEPIFTEHTCCSNVINSKVGKQTKKFEIVIHKYIKPNTWS